MHLYTCCILYYHFVYGVLSHYVNMILIVYGVMYWQSCVFCNCFTILYIYLVYLDYFYICGDCSPVRFLEVNKNSIQFNNLTLICIATDLSYDRWRQNKYITLYYFILYYITFDINGTVGKEFILAGQRVNLDSTLKFYGGCVKMCEDFAPNFGDKITGCCITTTCRFSPGSFFFYPKQKDCRPPPILLAWLDPL
jgi:hypothetical protein